MPNPANDSREAQINSVIGFCTAYALLDSPYDWKKPLLMSTVLTVGTIVGFHKLGNRAIAFSAGAALALMAKFASSCVTQEYLSPGLS